MRLDVLGQNRGADPPPEAGEFARLRVEIFKPRIDVRYSEEEVVSHDASAIRSTPVDSAQNTC